jgi:hypothetical protein
MTAIKAIAALIVCLLVWYLIGSLIAWNLDIGSWESYSRGLWLACSFLSWGKFLVEWG